MTKRTPIPAEGVTVPTPCPCCGGRLTWYGREWHLACACGLACKVGPAEARDLAWYLAVPGLLDTPLDVFIAEVLRGHNISIVPVVPELRAVYTAERKWRVLPVAGETDADRAARLSEQAALNGVQVTPMERDVNGYLIPWTGGGVPTLFGATSQRRKPNGTPLRWYEPIEVSPLRAHCPCEATGLCAHIRAVADWLRAWNEVEREREIAPPLPVAKAPVAYVNTGKYADLW